MSHQTSVLEEKASSSREQKSVKREVEKKEATKDTKQIIGPTEFTDAFPEELPSGLPPLRGIEHQIDFIPGSTIPNRPAYRSNPTDTKELQRQVDELMEKGLVRESMSPCAVPELFKLPKKGWYMAECA
ncbi:uncharacterized protein LOC119371156 [Jatropha curcas]|uniref:uncharacterized protein LOC119371156 n=1 Tax=Jatropha curcas TaxID=180498 RepID=UPI001894E635|nr:uncharacterized protein LOC119371156 [Jatropha curcas]